MRLSPHRRVFVAPESSFWLSRTFSLIAQSVPGPNALHTQRLAASSYWSGNVHFELSYSWVRGAFQNVFYARYLGVLGEQIGGEGECRRRRFVPESALFFIGPRRRRAQNGEVLARFSNVNRTRRRRAPTRWRRRCRDAAASPEMLTVEWQKEISNQTAMCLLFETVWSTATRSQRSCIFSCESRKGIKSEIKIEIKRQSCRSSKSLTPFSTRFSFSARIRSIKSGRGRIWAHHKLKNHKVYLANSVLNVGWWLTVTRSRCRNSHVFKFRSWYASFYRP